MADSLAVSKDQALAKLEPVPVWTPAREQLMAECACVDRARSDLLVGDIDARVPTKGEYWFNQTYRWHLHRIRVTIGRPIQTARCPTPFRDSGNSRRY